MNTLLFELLAQAQTTAAQTGTTPPPEQDIPPVLLGRLPMDEIWQFIVGVGWLQAVGMIAFGLIYLIYGWRIFKALVMINFAMIGLFGGVFLGRQLGSPLWGGIVGTTILAFASMPFMKYSVAFLGACAGAVLCGALWRSVSLPESLIWCGALVGLISGGSVAFSSFKTSIMTFTSLQGSAFIVIGVLSLLNGYPDMSERLTNAIYTNLYLLPVLLIAPTVGGIYFQNKMIKENSKWALPE